MKPTPYLISRRKAAHCLNMLARELGLGTQAEHWNGDDPDQWDNAGTDCVMALRGQTIVAIIHLDETTRRHVTIPRWDGLIRDEHLYQFDPSQYGLEITVSKDFLTGEKVPDSEGYLDFGDPPNLAMPPQPIQKRVIQGSIEVVR